MNNEMEAWWTTLDLTISCSHKNTPSWNDIQVGDVGEDGTIFECKECGQKYFVLLKIVPLLSEETYV